MRSLHFGFAFLASFVIGCGAQVWLNSPSKPRQTNQIVESPIKTYTVDQRLESRARVAGHATEVPELEKTIDQVYELNSSRFIESVHSMDKAGFRRFINNWWNNGNLPPKELIEDLLSDLLTIGDPVTRNRMIQLLRAGMYSHFNNSESDTVNIEEWVMAKVRGDEQKSQWLDVLSYWGVHDQKNIDYLVGSLNSYSNDDERVSALLALSRIVGPDLQDSDTREKVASIILPYLDSKNELERAAAIRAQVKYPSENFSERLTNALGDSSEKVRISAARVLMEGQRLGSSNIKDALVKNMQSTNLSAGERVTSFYALQFMPLEGKHYEAVYDFRLNDAHRLEQEYQRNLGGEFSPWL